ncbi:MTH1187 family thiamine-binding protein [Candidatus Bipolaricaulota bacterium]|nr:MTH1187 family thiamine-binding protein [Candidatus Bipolaricaulota bacterium]
MIAGFSIAPIGEGESLSPYVARAFRLIEASGLPFEHHAMGTNIEGNWDEVMSVMKACRDDLLRDCHRITLSIHIDDRTGGTERLHRKVASARTKMR